MCRAASRAAAGSDSFDTHSASASAADWSYCLPASTIQLEGAREEEIIESGTKRHRQAKERERESENEYEKSLS